MLTIEYLKEILDYNHITGDFRWNKQVSCRSAPGDLAGCLDKKLNYRFIKIEYRRYSAHRLAWFYYHGQWPKHVIDHINGNKTDNSIANLRDITNRENCNNRKSHRSGRLQGASMSKHAKKWASHIQIDGRQKTSGLFQY
jgi:hypothetical protein